MKMQKILLASLAGLFAASPAYAGGPAISFFSGLAGGVVGGSQDSVTPATEHPVARPTQDVPLPPVKPNPAIAVIQAPQHTR